ncbi:MAG: diguanylate cyclase domain-containing protein, partial [Deinococcus sp.]
MALEEGAFERTLLDNVGDAVVAFDTELRVSYLNMAARVLYRVGPEVIGRRDIFQYRWLKEADGEAAWAAMSLGLPWSGDAIHLRRDGSELRVALRITATHDRDGRRTGFFGTIRDVTELRASEERLRLLESVAVNASEAVIISAARLGDAELRVVYVNEAYTRMTGYPAEEIVGRNPRMMQGPDTSQDTRRRVREGLRAGQPVRETLLNYRKDGTPFWVQLSITPALDDAGGCHHWVSIQRDVTAERLKHSLECDRREVLEAATRRVPLPQVLTMMLRLLERQLPGMTASMLTLRGGRLWLSCESSLPPEFSAAIDGLLIGENVGSCGTAASSGRPVMVSDIGTDPRWADYRELAAAAGLRSCWSVPLLSQNQQVLGTFALYGPVPRAASSQETELLEDAARLASIVMERYNAQSDMQQLVRYDPLTQLPNRSHFEQRLSEVLAQAQAQAGGQRVAVGLLDLDRFKNINDTLGHSAGDELLQQVAGRLLDCLWGESVVGRLGGDEFTFIVPGVRVCEKGAQDVALVARRILGVFDEPFQVAGCEVFVQGSLGFALGADDAATPGELLSQADVAMYRAKRKNRGWALFRDLDAAPGAR